MVARPRRSRTGPATTGATRWTARSSPRSAGAPTTAFEDGPGRDRRLVPGERGVVAGDPVGRLGRLVRAPVRAAARDAARRRRPCPRPATDARRRHRGRPDGSAGASSTPWPMRRSPARPGRSPGTATRSTSTRPTASARGSTRDRPEVVVHAAAWTDVDGCALDPELAMRRNGGRDRASSPRPAPTRGIDLLVVSTNEVFDGTRLDGYGYLPDRPGRPGQPVRRIEGGGRAPRARPPSPPDPGPRSGSPGRPGCSGRPGSDFPSRILDAAERARGGRRAAARSSTTSGGRRPTRPTSPTPSSSCWPRTRRPASTTSSTACSRRGPTGRATSSAGRASRSTSSTSRPRPGSARRGRRAGASSRRRRCRPASRCASWPDAMADYAPALLRARRVRA